MGVAGVVLKDSPPEILFKSIRAVMGGEYWLGHERFATVATNFRKVEADRRRAKAFGLTKREIEIVRSVVAGYSNKEIAEFCRTTYGIEFPMFEKAEGTRVAANPMYVELVAKTGQAPQWNFHKYLVDRSGKRVHSFASAVEPSQRDFVSTLERLLSDKPGS